MNQTVEWLLTTLRWGALIFGALCAAWLMFRIARWCYAAFTARDYKSVMFTLEGWVTTIVHDLVLGGIALAIGFTWMQVRPDVEVFVNLPTIEHTFKK